MTIDKDSAKRDRNELATALKAAGAQNTDRKAIKCPFHDDKHPSASITQAQSGFWYFYCYACDIKGADVFEIRSRIEGREVGDILKDDFPQNQIPIQPLRRKATPAASPPESFTTGADAVAVFKNRNSRAIVEAVHKYDDPDTGEISYAVMRYRPTANDKKKFLPLTKHSDDQRWYWEHPTPTPLYNRARVKKADSVIFVEGEKCVDLFHSRLDFDDAVAATTAPQGSNGIAKADLSPLAGKAIYVLRDNDEGGEKWAENLIARLLELQPFCNVMRARVEDLGLPPKGDLEQILDIFPGTKSETTDAVQSFLEISEPMSATAPLYEQFRLIREGKFKVIHFPNMPVVSHMTKALIPGTVTILCGDPSSAKSFMLLEWFWRWSMDPNLKVRLLMLEDKTEFHQRRVLAQMAGASEIADYDKHFANPDKMDLHLKTHHDDLEIFSRNLEVTQTQKSLTELAEWIERYCEDGYDILGIDPLTASAMEQNQFIADSKFIFRIRAALDRSGTRVIFATHPRGGKQLPGLGSMALGMAYPRFSQSVFWLQSFNGQTQNSPINVGLYSTLNHDHNRTLEIRKARSGPGAHRHIAVNFNKTTLCFEEVGLIQKP